MCTYGCFLRNTRRVIYPTFRSHTSLPVSLLLLLFFLSYPPIPFLSFTNHLPSPLVPPHRQKVRFPIIPPDFTAHINTAVVLVILVGIELVGLISMGLAPAKLINTGKQAVDRLGHLAGYATGALAGYQIRKNDPYWSHVERRSFWRSDDGGHERGRQKGVSEVSLTYDSAAAAVDSSGSSSGSTTTK